jgi:predicted metal-binding membrane protein
LTLLELILRHERRMLAAALIAIPVLCWAWIVPMARDMYGTMAGASAWMMTPVWDARHVTLLGAMWIVMMIGMMVPAVAPTLLIYAGVMRSSPEGPRAALRVYPMAAGYLLVWIAFSVLATALQRTLGATLITPMMTVRSSLAVAGLLGVAAIYQLTPMKRVCLQSCQSPIAFLVARLRPGASGAFRLGIEHGLYCVGCCWALMLLLFAGGVMNLSTIAALMVVILLERLEPFGLRTRQLSAVALMAIAAWVMVR